MNWLPIESAPKDGSYFVIANFGDEHDPFDDCPNEYEIAQFNPYGADKFVEVEGGLFRKEHTVYQEFRANNFHRATHWMPLPEPPK